MATRPQLVSGARGLIQALNDDGTIINLGFATDINVNVRHSVKPTYVMGEMNAAAIDSLTYDVDCSIGRVIPVNASDAAVDSGGNPPVAPRSSTVTSRDIGLEANSGGTHTTGTAAGFFNDMIFTGELNIVLQDRVTGAYIASVKSCRFAGRTLNNTSGDLSNERLNFVGIYDTGYIAKNGQPRQAPEMGYGVNG